MSKNPLINRFKKSRKSSIRYGDIDQLTRPSDIQNQLLSACRFSVLSSLF
jgi:hypothetical protein